MRGTIHLVTADDALLLRPLVQPVLDGEMARHRDYAPHLRDVDLTPCWTSPGRCSTSGRAPCRELRPALAERFTRRTTPAPLAFACRNRLALVQVPPRGVWGRRGQVTPTTAESWLGRPLVADARRSTTSSLRYLAAFGPATAGRHGRRGRG